MAANKFEIIPIGKPARWLVEAALEIGLDVSGLTHEITSELKIHVMKRHGSPEVAGAMAITGADFERIPDIVSAPDHAVIGAVRKGALMNAYAKAYGGATYLYFDEVLRSRKNKALRGKTFYKVNKELTLDGFIKIVTMNGKTDISGAKKI
jgi:hypothetical protein